ncbi:ABC-F family ATP-binding cassette domain-containing protein [Saprospiraceae bacterium]|jgi:ATP-binding cassette subfamily F protein uup|nr:ABC-F family ATP-binding cassette domain-containing protein [Bacteroidota bacterium]MDB4727660.1 ABC-F family ATP-binding cassette domain-containing protein [Saprospiraceae bacterium]
MNYLNLENVSKTYGEKVLFKDLNLQIAKGQKVALVAKNGTGKSTLMRVIMGEEAGEGETAKVIVHKDIRVGFLNQDPDFFEGHTVMEAVFDSENEMIQAIKKYETAILRNDDELMQESLGKMDDLKAWDFEAKIKEILFKLNITNLEQPVSNLSGGQKKRLALAKLVIDEPEFVILDEPTNHLDMDMIEWLEDYLKQPNLTIFMITHDRYFLENVCNNIVELEGGNLYRYSGNYSEFLEKKAIRQENEGIELEKTKKLFQKELDWVRRQPKARTTKAKSRVDKFFDIKEKAHKIQDNQEMSLDNLKGARLGSKILECEYINKSYGDLKLVDNFFYKFRKGERVGIVGKNGVGKTTFLKLLTKEIRPDSGKVVVGGTIKFGYYTQDGMNLQENKRVIDVVRDVAEYIPVQKGHKLTAAALLELFLFSRKHQQVYVSQLSGGEKRRLYLLTILMQNPNFLILDEPTNDLDIVTLNVLEEWLMDFPGCVIMVSHDRYFMDKLVEHLFIFEGQGKIKDFNGNHKEYRAYIKEKESKERSQERAEEEKRKAQAVKEQAQNSVPALSYEERKEMNRIEKEISKLEEKKSKIHEQFLNPDLPLDEMQKLSKELKEIEELVEEKEMVWMEFAERA